MHATQGQSAWLHKRSLAGYSRALQGGQIHPGCQNHGDDGDDVDDEDDGGSGEADIHEYSQP